MIYTVAHGVGFKCPCKNTQCPPPSKKKPMKGHVIHPSFRSSKKNRYLNIQWQFHHSIMCRRDMIEKLIEK